MNMVVAYDICHPRRLYRVARVMRDYGIRVQKSIFEVHVSPPRFLQMRLRCEAVMDPDEDGVKYFPLCGACNHRWYALGRLEADCLEQEYEIV